MNISSISIEEVRCFSDRQQLNVRPLTFLVGENSTGKTTSLACFQILADFLSKGEVDFNLDPYSMGVFGDIVRRSKKTEKSFRIGYSFSDAGGNFELVAVFVEREGGVEPFLSSAILTFDDGEIVFEFRDSTRGSRKAVQYYGQGSKFRICLDSAEAVYLRIFFLLTTLTTRGTEAQSEVKSALVEYIERKSRQHRGLSILGSLANEPTVVSSSPVRSRPKRTYEPLSESADPEGGDAPMTMMLLESTLPNEWSSLKQHLVHFGELSGLYQGIEVKNLGGSKGAPFQLMVKVRGPAVSIANVGYGVSQILPILVKVLDFGGIQSRDRGRPMPAYFLIQQPEVHLHPKAQAELSSLFAQLANIGNQSFLIETHSDYLVDRARIEIRRGNIKAEDVSLIFLEPKKNVVKVHNISFDKMGNMIGVPPHFREFFLLESDRLMGFED